jgi:hypothetical protein
MMAGIEAQRPSVAARGRKINRAPLQAAAGAADHLNRIQLPRAGDALQPAERRGILSALAY